MNFTLNEQEVIILGRALSMLPYAEVVSLINNLNNQINEQKKEETND